MYRVRIICEIEHIVFIQTICKKTLVNHHLKGGVLKNKQLLKQSHTNKVTNIIAYMLCVECKNIHVPIFTNS